jgi:nitrite reductase/ring-hydroxylating ferredoxin subunit
MYKRIPVKPYPTGWYVVAASHELMNGAILTRKFCGKEIVIFRTQAGKVCVADAYCPHMGAHFAHGGTVEGETIKCPFHHFCFDTSGACTATGYGTKPSPRMNLPVWHYREKNGFIICWFDEMGIEPFWEVPDIENNGFSKILTTDWELKSHPQETTENSVDIGHFGIVHKYANVNVIRPLRIEGQYLNSRYSMQRPADLIGSKELMTFEFDVHVWGLGYSFVEVDIAEFGIQTRHYVFPSPLDGQKINLKIGISIKIINPDKLFPFLSLLPHNWLTGLLLPGAFKGYENDVLQDFKIWENKIYIDPPALAKGDGPVAQYRQWCRQFYHFDDVKNLKNEIEEPLPIMCVVK